MYDYYSKNYSTFQSRLIHEKKRELYEFFKRSAEDTVNLKVSDKQTCTVIYLYSNFNHRKMVYHLWGLVACYLRILNMPYVHC